MPDQQILANTSAALSANAFTRTGYTFGGWAATSGGSVTYADGANYAAGAGTNSVALYAVWTAKTYTISFNNAGGTGGQTGTVTATFGQPMPAITAVPSSDAGTFNGYWDAASGGKKYYNADRYSAANWDMDAEGAVTLYAQFVSLTAPSVVSLVQSTKAQASELSYDDILALTREAIELTGGLNGIVKSGDVVVLKPNVIVTGYNWGSPTGNHIPELLNGVCTDRRVIQAVAQIVREIVGPYDSATGKGKIMAIEGSGSGQTTVNFANLGYTLANFVNVDEIIALENEGSTYSAGNDASNGVYATQVTLGNYNYKTVSSGSYSGASPYVTYYHGDGKYYVNKKMYEADALICIPVVKSHWDAGVTGSIKNIGIGATPPRIYGISASSINGRNGMVNHASYNLHEWIADYFSCLPADFVVMDGLQGLQNGPEPSANNVTGLAQHQKNLRCILASKDPLAIDTVEANIVGWDYSSVRYLTLLAERGEAGPKPNGRVIPLHGDPKDIIVLGNKKVDEVRGYYTQANSSSFRGSAISTANRTPPTVTINSAAFSGSNLNLNLSLSSGASNNVVKIDVYIDGAYKESFNAGMTSVLVDASSLAGGSHSIEVRAYTNYMYSATAATTAIK